MCAAHELQTNERRNNISMYQVKYFFIQVKGRHGRCRKDWGGGLGGGGECRKWGGGGRRAGLGGGVYKKEGGGGEAGAGLWESVEKRRRGKRVIPNVISLCVFLFSVLLLLFLGQRLTDAWIMRLTGRYNPGSN